MGSQCGHRFGATVVVLGLVAGLAMLALGLSKTVQAPDASQEFRVLSSECVITNVFHEAKTQTRHNHATKKSDQYCFDTYTYTFAYCADASTCESSTLGQ